MSSKNNFIEELILSVKDAGQEIIDKASDICGSSEGLSRLTITIDFDPNKMDMFIPTINVDKEYVSMRIINRLNRRENK